MKTIENTNFPDERALYGKSCIRLVNCSFDGEEDGESALKESSEVFLDNCFMNLRYPLWHVNKTELNGCEMTDKCRAALWYSKDISIRSSLLHGIKALRECSDARIEDTEVKSPEFGWKCHGIEAKNCDFESEYPFFLSDGIRMKDIRLKGKYSFQYTENVIIEDSFLDTKDAFWHAKNVILRNCTIKSEYLAWYSENLVFDHCSIIGTQPFCYCRKLTVSDCKMEDADLSFEYSDVNATITGSIISVKNPRSGSINADFIDEIIITGDSKYPCECIIAENR